MITPSKGDIDIHCIYSTCSQWLHVKTAGLRHKKTWLQSKNFPKTFLFNRHHLKAYYFKKNENQMSEIRSTYSIDFIFFKGMGLEGSGSPLTKRLQKIMKFSFLHVFFC